MLIPFWSDEAHMSSSHLIQRLLRRRPAAPAPSSRIDITPPALWGQAEPVWTSLWHWLKKSDPLVSAPVRLLDCARTDFCKAMSDLRSDAVLDLQQRAGHARSLRELWHLRAELYNLIGMHLNQAEADRRLALVNRHFPARAAGPSHASSSDRHVQRTTL